MRSKRIRSILWLTMAAFLSGSVVVVVVESKSPPRNPGTSTGRVGLSRESDSEDDPSSLPPLASFEPLWNLRLNGPLFDPAPKPKPQQVPKTPKLPTQNFALVGTIEEPGHSLALFKTAKGKIELKGIGDSFGPPADQAKVLKIEEESVMIHYRGQDILLELKKPEKFNAR